MHLTNMDMQLIALALALPEDASDRDILDRIADLRSAAGEDNVEDYQHIDMMKLGLHPNVTITPSGAEVSLYTPIKSGSEDISTLTMRRPTAKQLKELDEGKKGDLAKLLKMGAELSGKTESQFDKLDGADVKLVVDVIVFLRRPPRRTGARS